MHEMQTIVTDVRSVCLSVCPYVCLSRRVIRYSLCQITLASLVDVVRFGLWVDDSASAAHDNVIVCSSPASTIQGFQSGPQSASLLAQQLRAELNKRPK